MKSENINIGDFNEQLTWLQPTETKDSFGQVIRSFVDYRTDWVEVSPAGQSETETANRLNASEILVFTTHYDPAMESTWQVRYNNNEYNILKPIPVNGYRFMKTTAYKLIK